MGQWIGNYALIYVIKSVLTFETIIKLYAFSVMGFIHP